MRISDWSSDVCSSDLEEIDHDSQGDAGPDEEPQAPLALRADQIEVDRRDEAAQREPERRARNVADDRGDEGDGQDGGPGDGRLPRRSARMADGDAEERGDRHPKPSVIALGEEDVQIPPRLAVVKLTVLAGAANLDHHEEQP